MSTDIVRSDQPTEAVAIIDQDFTGLSSVVRIKPSNLTLIQPMTQNPRTARVGQYLDELTGEAYDSLTLVPLRVTQTRVLFPPGNSFGEEAVCRSNDGIYPSPFANAPQAQSCATCPQSKWVDNQKPPCRLNLNLLAVVKETSLPRYVNFTGTGVKVLRMALESIQQDIMLMSKTQNKKYNLYDYFFTLTVDVIRKTSVYAMPRIEGIKKVSNPSEFGPLFQEFVLDRLKDVDEENAEAEVDGAVGKLVEGVALDDKPPFDVSNV